MPTGLIVGKFCPLHSGHEFLIREAQARCDKLFIISYSNPEFENCLPEQRLKWLEIRFPEIECIVLGSSKQPAELNDLEIPKNDADDLVHRVFCAQIYTLIFNKALDFVFTSENYGDGFVAELNNFFRLKTNLPANVKHCKVDQQRLNVPISGSTIRRDPFNYKQYLAPEVYSSFVSKVCFLGGESSGKSTLVELLAKRFNTKFVAEYGRALWEEKRGQLDFEDMLQIAKKHVSEEEKLISESNKFLFIDTSPLTTWLYSQHYFNLADPELTQMTSRMYDYVFLCAPDFPFVQDGTRIDDEFRKKQHQRYILELSQRNIRYHLITGSLEDRVQQVSSVILKNNIDSSGKLLI